MYLLSACLFICPAGTRSSIGDGARLGSPRTPPRLAQPLDATPSPSKLNLSANIRDHGASRQSMTLAESVGAEWVAHRCTEVHRRR